MKIIEKKNIQRLSISSDGEPQDYKCIYGPCGTITVKMLEKTPTEIQIGVYADVADITPILPDRNSDGFKVWRAPVNQSAKLGISWDLPYMHGVYITLEPTADENGAVNLLFDEGISG